MTGRTLSPVEPSEAMYTLNEGHLNAGCIFLIVALLSTLLLGRFVCGWGCHVVAYQDLCAWLLKKIGIKVKPFRSRLLVLAPLALAFYMFFWPTLYRWGSGAPAPSLANHLLTTDFWKTFPGPAVAVLTVLVCGFVIVYFLGAKGFCTYGCPYGGLFAVVDRVAPGRIRVTDDCEHCGHCTAVCTSNVRVHEEVALYGMVVDPGCMKCMDCVSVCPNDALYFGFAARSTPSGSLQAAGPAPRSDRPIDFTLWEELLFGVVGLAALLSFRGLYGQIPLLLAMGLAAVFGFVAVKSLHMLRSANVRLQNWQLKRGGRWTRVGVSFALFSIFYFVFTLHSGVVQYNAWRGRASLAKLQLGDEVWLPNVHWAQRAEPEALAGLEGAVRQLERADSWGLVSTPAVLQDLVWVHLAQGNTSAAESVVRRLIDLDPSQPEPFRGLAGVLQKTGRLDGACAAYEQALRLDPHHFRARMDLVKLLQSMGRVGEAADHLRRALELDPDQAEMRYALALTLLREAGRESNPVDLAEAVAQLRRVVTERPAFAEAHYNLGVAVFMSGDPAAAVPHIQESLRLQPDDSQAREFLKVVETELATTPP